MPYSQLRFPDKDVHTWGLNVSRWNARTRESSRLVHTPKTESGFVSRFADLTGITASSRSARFEIVPYGVARTDLHSRADNPFVAAVRASHGRAASTSSTASPPASRSPARSIPTSARWKSIRRS